MFDFITQAITSVVSWVNVISGGNQFVTATIIAGLAILGRGLPFTIGRLIKQQLTSELVIRDGSVHDREELIDAIVNNPVVSNGPFSRRHAGHFNANTGQLEVQVGLGWHLARVKDGWILLKLEHLVVDAGHVRILELVTFKWWAKDLNQTIAEIGCIDHDAISMFTISDSRWSSRNGNFQATGKIKRSRYANQKQFINPEQYDILYEHVDRFVNNPKYFEELNIAYKMCFLLYGPPGGGKSTLARHFACLFNLPLIEVKPSNIARVREGMTYSGIKRAVLVLDDIDEYLEQHGASLGEFGRIKPRSDIGDLITHLDGIYPLDGCLIFINTNEVELLKGKLYRPGRVDLRMELTYPRPEVILNILDMREDDPRARPLIDRGALNNLPLHYITRLRKTKTVEQVNVIIDDRDHYFKMVEDSVA